MKLTKMLVKANNEPTAVMVTDGDTSYPILLEGLHLKVVFDSLIESGYEFCGLPFDFRKDGMTLDQLPRESYSLTQSEELEMFDMLENERYTNDELKARVVKAKVNYLKEPETNYTITTRDAFIRFLKAFNPDDTFSSFQPVNSFVSPDARFTLEEYFAEENQVYIEKLNRYRQFNYTRWVNFLNWTGKDFNDYKDVIRFYFQWGLDGLNLPLIAAKEQMLAADEDLSFVTADDKQSVMFVRREIGLVDRNGTILLPEGVDNNTKFTPVYATEYVNNLKAGLAKNETAILELKTYRYELYLYKEGLDETIKISPSKIQIRGRMYSPLRVYPNGLSMPAADLDLWTKDKLDLLAEDAYMYALARDTIHRRIAPCTASSAKALSFLGLSKRGIIMHMLKKLGADKEQKLEDGMVLQAIADTTVDSYVEGSLPDGNEKEYLDSILDGTVNVDSIATALQALSQHSVTRIYNQIYAMHKIFGIPLDDIQTKIFAMGEEDSFTVSNSRGYTFEFKQPINRDLFKAYYKDIQDYRIRAASTAYEYIFITEAYREMGTLEAKRHVGINGYVVNARSATVKMLINVIKDEYEKVISRIPNEIEQNKWRKDADYFAATKYFEVGLKGSITFPQKLGGEVKYMEQDFVNRVAKTLVPECDILTAVCEGNELYGEFRYFFVNAYVSADFVVPIKNQNILQMDFAVAWPEWDEVMLSKLYAKSAITTNHQALELYACSNNYTITEHVFGDETTLYNYYLQGQQFVSALKEGEPFKAVPHPTEYLYPGVYGQETEEEELPASIGKPKMEVAPLEVLKLADHMDMFDVEGNKDEKPGFKQYVGLSSEAFWNSNTPREALEKTVDMSVHILNVVLPDKFFMDGQGPYDYRDITKFTVEGYPVKHMYGRIYLVRDTGGRYYTVEV